MRKLLDITAPQMVESGIFPSLPPKQPAVWRDGVNVFFRDGAVEKAGGYTNEASQAGANITALAEAFADGQARVYYASDTDIWEWFLGVSTHLGGGFAAGGLWSLETFGTFLLATNFIDPPQWWPDTGGLVAIPNTTFLRARVIRKLANYVLVFNTDQGGDWVNWCDRDDPTTWVSLESNTAGGEQIRDLDGDILAAEYLGNLIAFYTHNMMGTVQWVGGDFTFDIQVRLRGIGAASLNAIVSVGNVNYGLSKTGFFWTDGFSFQWIDTPAMRQWFMKDVDWTKSDSIFGFHHKDKSLIIWSYVALDGNTKQVCFNYLNQRWGRLEFPLTAGIEQRALDNAFIAAGSVIGYFDLGDDLAGAAMTSTLTTAPQSMGNRNQLKSLDKIEVDIEDQIGDFQFRVGYSNTGADTDVVWGPWESLTYENWLTGMYPDSAFWLFEFQSNTVGSHWRFEGFTVHGELTGSTP